MGTNLKKNITEWLRNKGYPEDFTLILGNPAPDYPQGYTGGPISDPYWSKRPITPSGVSPIHTVLLSSPKVAKEFTLSISQQSLPLMIELEPGI